MVVRLRKPSCGSVKPPIHSILYSVAYWSIHGHSWLLLYNTSINISKPGITKGQHWHNSKWVLFIVVHGHGLIQERNINTGEMVEFEVSGEKIEAVHMIPGWTHNIINLSDTEDLVTVMTCNEIFDPMKPDTFWEPV